MSPTWNPASGPWLTPIRVENFFGHLKSEMFYCNRFDTVEEFTTALDAYIHWYNAERISTKLKGLSPVQYRAQALAA